MPDVTGRKLDVAYDRIQNAGFADKDQINIEGGGTFGVMMEGNWTVCEQSPAAGASILRSGHGKGPGVQVRGQERVGHEGHR